MTTLARLSFDVSGSDQAGSEAEWCARLRPLLARHGLTISAEQGRPTRAGVCAVLLEFGSLAEAFARGIRAFPFRFQRPVVIALVSLDFINSGMGAALNDPSVISQQTIVALPTAMRFPQQPKATL